MSSYGKLIAKLKALLNLKRVLRFQKKNLTLFPRRINFRDTPIDRRNCHGAILVLAMTKSLSRNEINFKEKNWVYELIILAVKWSRELGDVYQLLTHSFHTVRTLVQKANFLLLFRKQHGHNPFNTDLVQI